MLFRSPASGPGLVTEVRRAAALPVMGIGGINTANLAEVIAAGAMGVAVIGAILGSADPRAASARLRDELKEAWARQTARQ